MAQPFAQRPGQVRQFAAKTEFWGRINAASKCQKFPGTCVRDIYQSGNPSALLPWLRPEISHDLPGVIAYSRKLPFYQPENHDLAKTVGHLRLTSVAGR